MANKTLAGVTTAWITDTKHFDMDLLLNPKGREAALINDLSYYDADMEALGWVRVGKATITLELEDQAAVVENQIDTLKATLKAEEGKFHKTKMEIEDKINQLLALPNYAGEE